MKKNIIKLGLLLVVGLLVLTGCTSKESDKEVLVDSLDTTATSMTSFESSFDLTMDMEMDAEVDPENLFGDFLSSINLKGTMKTDVTNSLFELNLSTSLMGMGIEVHAIMDENLLAIKAPFVTSLMGMGDVYMLTDVEKDESIPDVRVDDAIKEFNRVLKESVSETIDEKSIKIEENATLTTPEGDVSGQRIDVNLTDKEIVDFLETLNQKMDESELLETDDEFADETLDVDDLNFNGTFKLSFFVDKDHIVRSTDIDANLTNPEDEHVNLKLNFMLWNINQAVDINMPTFDDTNSIRLDDFFEGALFFE